MSDIKDSMKKIVGSLIDDLSEINAIKYMKIIVFVVTVCCFLFEITHPVISVDDLAFDIYYDDYLYILMQGRFTSFIIHMITGLYRFSPVILDFLAVIFLIISAQIFAIIIKRNFNNIKDSYLILFVVLFVSFPLICEIFVYMQVAMTIGLGYFFIALSVYIMELNLKYKTLYSVIPLTLALGGFESFITVFICFVFIVLLLRSTKGEISDFMGYFKEGLKYFVLLLMAVISKTVLSLMLKMAFGLTFFGSGGASNQIMWFAENIVTTFQNLLVDTVYYYGVGALFYFPITIVFFIYILFFIDALLNIFKKKYLIFLSEIGIMISPFLLSMIQGSALPFRTGQAFAIICSFEIIYILMRLQKRFIKNIIFFFSIILAIRQISDLNHWFYVEYLRQENEVKVVDKIGSDIQSEFDYENKEIVFIGDYTLPNVILDEITPRKNKNLEFFNHFLTDAENIKFNQTSIQSYINWGKNAFESERQLLLFKLRGFDFNYTQSYLQFAAEEKREINEMAENYNSFPHNNYIFEFNNYIVVKFSD